MRRLSILRARARLLLKRLRSDDPLQSAQAAARFLALRTLARDPARLAARARLKHALTVIALEEGYPSWPSLKAAGEPWYVSEMSVYLNLWFARYEDARCALDEGGGFLLPYGRQFFVCQSGAIAALGLDPDDPDWRRIDWDCARPADRDAYDRLRRRLDARRVLGRQAG